MNNIFIINRVFYDSDDGNNKTTLIGYVLTEDLAIQKVADLNRLHELAVIIEDKLVKYLTEVIIPSLEVTQYEVIPQYPKWKDGIHQNEITVEMRDERNRIIKLQEEVTQRNNEKSRAKEEKVKKLKQDYIDSLHLCSEVLKVMGDEQGYEYNPIIGYKYEKIEELK